VRILDAPERDDSAAWRSLVGHGVCIHALMLADHTFRRAEEFLKIP
jgi:hypothetical protein